MSDGAPRRARRAARACSLPPPPPLLLRYGLNIASLARLPESVIKRAAEKSAEFEAAVVKAEAEAKAGAGGMSVDA